MSGRNFSSFIKYLAITVAVAGFAAAATAQTFTINGKVYMKTPDGKMVEVPATSTASAPASAPRSADPEHHTGKRYALVIGNTAYDPPIEQLVNPKKDSRDMCAALKRLGFEVSCFENVKTRRDLVERVDAFSEKLRRGAREGAVGLFYYAGHGVQTGGVNYLLPTAAVVKRERDLEYESMSLAYVMSALADAKNPFNIVILDACRNNPIPGSRTRAIGDKGGGGLTSVKGPIGTFIAFATAEGDVSYDGPLNGNGIFTKHILLNLEKPGLKLEDVFKRVTQGVTDETMNMDRGPQVPWISASFRGEFCFVSCRDPAVDDFIAKLRIEKEAEVERLQLEKGLIEKEKRLMELELSKRDSANNSELQRLRNEKAALEADKRKLEQTMATVRSTQQAQPARASLSKEEQAQVEQLRKEMAQLKAERGDAEQRARLELTKLQAEKSRMETEKTQMEAEMKVQQQRLKDVKDEARAEEGKKKVFVPPSF